MIAKLQIRLSQIEDHLRGDRFALGDAFSVVDAYLFTILNCADGLKVDLSPYPSIRAYLRRVSTQPSVRVAMTSEGLVQAAAA